MRRLRFHPEASLELNEAIDYYDSRVPGLGLEFSAEVERSGAQLLDHPESSERALADIRRKPLRRFPYSLFYVVEPGRVRILAVAHQKRRPGYWRGRL